MTVETVASAGPAGPPSAMKREGRSRGLVVAVGLAVLHLGWLLAHFAPAIMSPDANGYVVQARLLASDGRTSFAPESPAQFVGMHWLETSDGVFHSRYPAGLPMLQAVAWKIGGLPAALLVNPLLASATVLLVFFLARPLAGEICALLAAAVFATIPVVNQHALDADAHISATFFLVAGVLALRSFVAQPQALGRGIASGVLLGIVPTMRYPEAIVGLAIAGWLAWRIRPWWRAWPAAAGAALPLLALLAHNTAAYGAFWRTGYALTNEQTGFGFGYFASHALPYLQALASQGLALFFGFGAAGLVALVVDRRWRADGVLFAGIVAPLVLLYMAYYFGGGPGGGGAMAGNLRFLVPTFPFFAAAGAWVLSRLTRELGVAGYAALGAVALLQLLLAGTSSAQMLARTKATLVAAAKTRALAQEKIPAGSIVIVERTLAESLDATGEWRLVEENFADGRGPRGGMGMGIGPRPPGNGFGAGADVEERPSPQQRGRNRAQQERYAGLDASGRRARVWTDLGAWAAGKPVYWFTRSLEAVENALPAGADYERIAEIDAPPMSGFGPAAAAGQGGRFGGGAPGGNGVGPRGGRGGMRGPRFAPGAGPFGGPRGGPGFGPPGGEAMPGGGPNTGGPLHLIKITFANSG